MKILLNSGRSLEFRSTRFRLLNEIKNQNHEIFLTGFEPDFEVCAAAEGMNYIGIPFKSTGMSPLADLELLISYYRVMKANRISFVHSYTAKPNIYGSIAAWMAGIKQIYPVVNGLGYAYTGNDFKSRCVRFVMDGLYHLAFACSTKVFFQNQDDADEMIQKGIVREEKCVVINGSGIDLDAYPYVPPKINNVFLMATRLLITKGTRTYMEAAKIVKLRYPNAVFQLAGNLDPNPDGITKDELDEYISSGIIEYLGVVSDMPSALENCMVFVLPSYYREGIPHAVLEAMSVGRAIITADSIGCRETINGKNGFLVPPKNAEALAERMIWCVDHPEQVKEMGKESYLYAKERFDVDLVNHVMLKEMGLLQAENVS